jgi:hypothetical protein
MTRRKTDGERIAEKGRVVTQHGVVSCFYPQALAARIDRLIRKRMGEAWEEGWFDRDCQEADWDKNPYRRQTSLDRLIHTIQGRVKK